MVGHNAARLMGYWAGSAKYDFTVALALFDKRKYPYALFFCHLCLEKMLKALVVKATRKPADPIHNLVALAAKTKVEFNAEQIDFLTVVTQFNIQARYQGYKSNFYKKATRSYASEHLAKTKEMLKWLEKKLQN